MKRTVIFAPEAETDLTKLYTYIAGISGPGRAFEYSDRIAVYCETLGDFPERGQRHDELKPGLRVVGFERRVAIAFHFTDDTVIIDRILYGGRDLPTAFADDTG